MNKQICIEETYYLTLHNNISGKLFFDPHYPGDIVEVDDWSIYFTDKNGELFVGLIGPDQNPYDGDFHNEPELKKYFIPLADLRNQRIDEILED